MNKFRNTLFSLVALTIGTLAFSTNVYSQNSGPGGCVKCVGAGHGWICQSGSPGGEACMTDGGNCTLVNPCYLGRCSGPSVLSGTKANLNIEDRMIREVAKADPRMATVLISLRKLESLNFSEGVVNNMPIELTGNDVDRQLASAEDVKIYNSELKPKIAEALSKGLLPTVYRFTIEETSTDIYLLRIDVTESGSIAPQISSLEVTLSLIKNASRNSENTDNTLKATAWTIK